MCPCPEHTAEDLAARASVRATVLWGRADEDTHRNFSAMLIAAALVGALASSPSRGRPRSALPRSLPSRRSRSRRPRLSLRLRRRSRRPRLSRSRRPRLSLRLRRRSRLRGRSRCACACSSLSPSPPRPARRSHGATSGLCARSAAEESATSLTKPCAGGARVRKRGGARPLTCRPNNPPACCRARGHVCRPARAPPRTHACPTSHLHDWRELFFLFEFFFFCFYKILRSILD